MKTLDRYVVRETLVPSAAGFSVVLVLLIGNIIYNNINLIVSRLQQWPDVLYYILLKTPYFVMLSLPAGALFGCSLAVTRLARDSETTMMRMAGISARRVFLPIFMVGVLLSATAYLFQEHVAAWAEQESVKVLGRIWRAPGSIPIQPRVVFWYDNYCFYVNSATRHGDTLDMSGVMIYERPIGPGALPTLTTAKTATAKSLALILRNGTTFHVNRNGDPDSLLNFETQRMDLRRPLIDYFAQPQKTTEAMTLSELRAQMDLLQKSGQKADIYKLEYGFKLAIPLSSLVLMLCVAPLSLRFGRAGGFMGVLIGIVVLFFYWNVILFSRVLGQAGGLPPALAGWSEVIIFSLLGAYLIWKVE